MSTMRIMVPPEPADWAERPEVAAYRAQFRRELLAEELERRIALKLAPSPRVVMAARPEPDDRFAPSPDNPWGPVKIPQPWVEQDRPAQLSPADYAIHPGEPDWSQFRGVEPGSRSEPDPVQRRRVAPDLGYAPAPKNPWGA
jgi:hypothetical protein